jgi:hypothetical protein
VNISIAGATSGTKDGLSVPAGPALESAEAALRSSRVSAPGVGADLPVSPPLGTIAVPAPALSPEAAWRLEKWELQSVARFLLPGERIRGCCLHRIPGKNTVDVYFTPSQNSAHYVNLITCASVWNCPVCSARISERRRELLARAVAAWELQGGTVVLTSYTFSHRRSDALGDTLPGFLAAQSWMTGHRPYKRVLEAFGIIGAIKALEVTWGTHNGWHPHAHVLLFLPSGVDVAALEAVLYLVWSAAAKRYGLTMSREHGLKVQATYGSVAEYVAKWGHQPARRPWATADEMTKGHSKRAHRAELADAGYSPFDLLRWLNDTGESKAAELFRQYAAAFKRRRQLTWSPGLAELLGVADEADKSDEELADEIREESLLLAQIGREGWRAVRLLNQRGQLLEVARSGDSAQLGAFVRRLVAELDERDRLHVERMAAIRFDGGWGLDAEASGA